jgi:hypothetical protein
MFLIHVLGKNASNITSLSTSNNTSNIRTGQIFTGTSGGTNGERSVGIIIRPIQSTEVVPAGLLGLLNSLATIRQNHHHGSDPSTVFGPTATTTTTMTGALDNLQFEQFLHHIY